MNEQQFSILTFELIQTNESLLAVAQALVDPTKPLQVEDLHLISARIERLRKLRITAAKLKRG